MESDIIHKLKALGLNQLEAEVYHLLLREQPMTAYKVGKLLKKPTANIYKAIEVLAKDGAVMIEEGKNKLCKAVEPKEFITLLQRKFDNKAKEAAEALSQIKPGVEEEKTYSLESVDLALEKAIKMINAGKTIIVVDAFPVALEEIVEPIRKAIKRGVKVVIQSYQEIEIDGAEINITQNHNEVISYWQSQQLNVVVDGRESLVALFDQTLTNIFHATWSTNVYLSCILHAGRLCEQTLHKLMAVPDSEHKLKSIEEILEGQKFLRNSEVPGVQTLFQRHFVTKQ